LFEGVKFRLAVFISLSDNEHNFSTKFTRWYSDERNELFSSSLKYSIHNQSYETAIPKVASDIHTLIFEKVKANNGSLYGSVGEDIMYYHNTPVFWIRAHSYVPYFKSERDGEKNSTQLKMMKYDSEKKAKAATSLLASSIFYMFWVSNSDCYHLNKPEIVNFKFNWNTDSVTSLSAIEEKLSIDLKHKSVRRVYNYRTSGLVEYDEFYMKKSKPIIDQIDTVLAQHYGFTEEELDFIINYDIKYRMGKELNNGEGEE